MPITHTFPKASGDIDPKERTITFATKEELLSFVNKVRQAGGAEMLKALLPGVKSRSYQCLIARGLNFNCNVGGETCEIKEHPDDPENSYKWFMWIEGHDSQKIGKAIEDNLGLEVITSESNPKVIKIQLPLEIGNAAYAFDRGHPEFDGLYEVY